jgi:hypothetical protein
VRDVEPNIQWQRVLQEYEKLHRACIQKVWERERERELLLYFLWFFFVSSVLICFLRGILSDSTFVLGFGWLWKNKKT